MRPKPDGIDRVIAHNITLHRRRRGMSRHYLATQVGVRFQQIQKYENASNRVAASRLYRIAQVLDVPIACLFASDIPTSPWENFM